MTDERRERFQEQATQLHAEMDRRGLFEGDDEEAGVVVIERPIERVGISIGDLVYVVDDDELTVRREHGGREEWAVVDEHGEPGKWNLTPPGDPASN